MPAADVRTGAPKLGCRARHKLYRLVLRRDPNLVLYRIQLAGCLVIALQKSPSGCRKFSISRPCWAGCVIALFPGDRSRGCHAGANSFRNYVFVNAIPRSNNISLYKTFRRARRNEPSRLSEFDWRGLIRLCVPYLESRAQLCCLRCAVWAIYHKSWTPYRKAAQVGVPRLAVRETTNTTSVVGADRPGLVVSLPPAQADAHRRRHVLGESLEGRLY
jgi:hypothetical protein